MILVMTRQSIMAAVAGGAFFSFKGYPLSYDAWCDCFGYHIQSWKSWAYHTSEGEVLKQTFGTIDALLGVMDGVADLSSWQELQEPQP